MDGSNLSVSAISLILFLILLVLSFSYLHSSAFIMVDS